MMGLGCHLIPGPPKPPAPDKRQLRLGSSAIAVRTPIRIASCVLLRKCVIAFVSGPERAVRYPGLLAMRPSRLEAQVNVTWGRFFVAMEAGSGRYGDKKLCASGGK